jgi:formylglycine-generating enzyme required for sulfatase activity
MSHIFISYSHNDSEYAHKLAVALEHEGFTIWIDGRIDYGTAWPRVIQEKLDACAALIVLMTPRSYESDWVQNELNRAKRKGKAIFPFLLEGEESWLSVEAIQHVDVRNKSLPPPKFYEQLEQYTLRKSGKQERVTMTETILIDSDVSVSDTIKFSEDFRVFKLPDLSPILPPPFEWCEIPAGKIILEYGDWEKGEYITKEDEMTEVSSSFLISRFPITYAQFQVFVEDREGYVLDRWWNYSPEAQTWRQHNRKAHKSVYSDPDIPKTVVNWYEAVAFCQWLSRRFNDPATKFTLPDERQWQRAAQADTRNKYPWGDIPDSDRCNIRESMNEQPTSVDKYINGASPYNTVDLVGNVWEWCLDGVDERNRSNTLSLKGEQKRVLRGGSFGSFEGGATCVARLANPPIFTENNVGFRICTVT